MNKLRIQVSLYSIFLLILFASCDTIEVKSQNESPENKLHKFIDLLFAEENIYEINKIVQSEDNEESIWGKFKEIENLIPQNKIEAISKLKLLLNHELIESRQKLCIHNQLRELQVKNETEELLGIIIEFPNLNKSHLFAAYLDKRCRFINKDEEIYIVEEPIGLTSYSMDEFFTLGETVLYSEKFESGRNVVKSKKIKFNFLTSNGIKRIDKTDLELEDNEQLSRLIWVANSIMEEIILKGK